MNFVCLNCSRFVFISHAGLEKRIRFKTWLMSSYSELLGLNVYFHLIPDPECDQKRRGNQDSAVSGVLVLMAAHQARFSFLCKQVSREAALRK